MLPLPLTDKTVQFTLIWFCTLRKSDLHGYSAPQSYLGFGAENQSTQKDPYHDAKTTAARRALPCREPRLTSSDTRHAQALNRRELLFYHQNRLMLTCDVASR